MRLLIAALTAALLSAAITSSPTHATTDTNPTRILILGDSVTQGRDNDYTWRYFSWKGLEQTGATVDFVGPRTGTYTDLDTFGGTYADPAFDTDHAARWGLAMWETLYWNSETAPTVADLMTHDPDVIVETLGVNDFVWINQTPEQMIGHVREFVTRARAISPDVDFVLGTLPQTWIEHVPAYNAALPGLAEELSTETSRTVVAPVAQFVNGVDTYDPAHPTTQGQRKIAAAVAAGLEQLGIGRAVTMPAPTPLAPTLPQPTPAPVPQQLPAAIAPPTEVIIPAAPAAAPQTGEPAKPRRVRARRHARNVVVTWRHVRHVDHYIVKCGTKRRGVSDGRRTVLRTGARRCKVRSVNDTGKSPWTKKVPVRNWGVLG